MNKYEKAYQFFTACIEENHYKTVAGLLEVQRVLNDIEDCNIPSIYTCIYIDEKYIDAEAPLEEGEKYPSSAEVHVYLRINVNYERDIKKIVAKKAVDIAYVRNQEEADETIDISSYMVENFTDYQVIKHYEFFEQFISRARTVITDQYYKTEKDKQ